MINEKEPIDLNQARKMQELESRLTIANYATQSKSEEEINRIIRKEKVERVAFQLLSINPSLGEDIVIEKAIKFVDALAKV